MQGGGGPAPIAYWKFDETSGTSASDSSGNGNTGTLENGASFTTSKINNGVNLDGVNDDVSVPSSSTLNPSSAVSVAAWFKALSTGSYQFLINKFNHNSGLNSDDSYTLGLDPSGNLYWQVNTSVSSYLMTPTPSMSVFDGQFHHIAATYDGSQMKVYLDGALVSSISASGTVNASSTSVLLGASLNNGAKAFFHKGVLDEARIYNQTLSASDVLTLTQSNPTPAAYWKFDETTGASASDSSGNGNTGTLENGASFTTGRINNGVNLDGVNDDVSVPSSSTLNPSSAISVAAWFKALSTGSYQFLINKFNHNSGLNSDDSYTIGLDPSGNLYWQVNTSVSSYLMTPAPPSNILDGQFHHIAATYDGSQMKVYLDGALVSSISASGTVNASST